MGCSAQKQLINYEKQGCQKSYNIGPMTSYFPFRNSLHIQPISQSTIIRRRKMSKQFNPQTSQLIIMESAQQYNQNLIIQKKHRKYQSPLTNEYI